MQMRGAVWAVMLSMMLGCGSGKDDEATDGPDASTGTDAAEEPDADGATDSAPEECAAPLKPMLLYPSAGCDVQPQWFCLSAEAGARATRYCLCEQAGLHDDLGWQEGATKPWVGKGLWVYPEAGCDDSVSRVCSESTYEYGTWCGCTGKSYESMAPTTPYAHEGACDAGAPDGAQAPP